MNTAVSGIQGEGDSCLQWETDYEPINKEMDVEVWSRWARLGVKGEWELRGGCKLVVVGFTGEVGEALPAQGMVLRCEWEGERGRGAGNDALGRGYNQGKGSQAGHVGGAGSWPGGRHGGQQAWKAI